MMGSRVQHDGCGLLINKCGLYDYFHKHSPSSTLFSFMWDSINFAMIIICTILHISIYRISQLNWPQKSIIKPRDEDNVKDPVTSWIFLSTGPNLPLEGKINDNNLKFIFS